MGPLSRVRGNPYWHARYASQPRAQSRLRHEPLSLADALRIAEQRLSVGLRRGATHGQRGSNDGPTGKFPPNDKSRGKLLFILDERDPEKGLAQDGRFRAAAAGKID